PRVPPVRRSGAERRPRPARASGEPHLRRDVQPQGHCRPSGPAAAQERIRRACRTTLSDALYAQLSARRDRLLAPASRSPGGRAPQPVRHLPADQRCRPRLRPVAGRGGPHAHGRDRDHPRGRRDDLPLSAHHGERAMSILELRILPPLAIARLGSSDEPLENYELELPAGGLGFRRIAPARTLYVDAASGEIADARDPPVISFRDGDRIRPVAPFLEVYARTADDVFEPLTLDLLRRNGLAPETVRWTVEVGNIKAFRRTGDPGDKAIAKVAFSDHAVHALDATAANFLPGKVLPLGSARYIKPNGRFPGIRLRFTPAKGLIYGASETRIEIDENGNRVQRADDVVAGRVIYDGANKDHKWLGWVDTGDATTTNPGAIYAGYADENGNQVSWGYLDDECDGFVSVELTTG